MSTFIRQHILGKQRKGAALGYKGSVWQSTAAIDKKGNNRIVWGNSDVYWLVLILYILC
jgi:hypothetical protein